MVSDEGVDEPAVLDESSSTGPVDDPEVEIVTESKIQGMIDGWEMNVNTGCAKKKFTKVVGYNFACVLNFLMKFRYRL